MTSSSSYGSKKQKIAILWSKSYKIEFVVSQSLYSINLKFSPTITYDKRNLKMLDLVTWLFDDITNCIFCILDHFVTSSKVVLGRNFKNPEYVKEHSFAFHLVKTELKKLFSFSFYCNFIKHGYFRKIGNFYVSRQ